MTHDAKTLADDLENYKSEYSGKWYCATPSISWVEIDLIIHALRCAGESEKMRLQLVSAQEVIKTIAAMPLSKDCDYDERGRIANGSHSYGPNYAAWKFQEIAKAHLAKEDRPA